MVVRFSVPECRVAVLSLLSGVMVYSFEVLSESGDANSSVCDFTGMRGSFTISSEVSVYSEAATMASSGLSSRTKLLFSFVLVDLYVYDLVNIDKFLVS